MKRINLANNNFYRSWSNQRDVAAERLLDNSKRRTTEITDKSFIRAIEMIAARYPTFHNYGIQAPHAIDRLHKDLKDHFNNTSHEIYQEVIQLRLKSWMLSHVAEAFAVAAIAQKSPKLKASQQDVMRLEHQDPKLLHRIQTHFIILTNKIMSALYRSIVRDETKEQALGRVYLALPKREKITSVRKLKRLTKVKESNLKESTDALTFSNDGKLYDWTFDSITWKKIQDEYNEEYLPIDRSPTNVFDITNPFNDEPIKSDIPTSDAIYGWEVEQETTHDFVQAVRSGEMSAAKENGVDDFMWVAILDKKTCENCCEWRDGLTSKEIEEKLEADPELKDYCDAIVPPAHFNCRCRPAPMSNQLEDFEPKPDMELDEWLNSLQ